MTRKHFTALAWNLRQQHPRMVASWPVESDMYCGGLLYWERAVLAVADACAASNGRFDRVRFLVAAGYSIRPDGSMFPMAAPR